MQARARHAFMIVTLVTGLAPAPGWAESYRPGREPRAPEVARATGDSADAETSRFPSGSMSVRSFYRTEDLIWSIAGGSVNVISELTWDDVRSGGIEVGVELDVWRQLELRGQLAYGRIVDGTVRDSDYAGSNRTLEFSRSRSQTKRGSVWDVELALGWVRPLSDRWIVTPLLGLSYHQQNYNIRDGVQQIPALGPSPLVGLDSDYDGEWYGFFWGGELRHVFSERLELRASFTSHHTAYHADGFFNLRSDLGDPSFSHDTFAEGSTFGAGLEYVLSNGWVLQLDAQHRIWESDSGRTKFRIAGGGASRQRFNDIDFKSTRISVGLIYDF